MPNRNTSETSKEVIQLTTNTNSPQVRLTGLCAENQDSQTFKILDAIVKGQYFKLRWHYRHASYLSASATHQETGAKYSKLLIAVINDHASIVKFLMNQKLDYFDLHHWNEDNKNPLIEAIKQGHVGMVRTMTEHATFFDRSFKDKEGNTPLHYAGKLQDEKKRKAIATLLIKAGIDIDIQNNQDKKPDNYAELVSIKTQLENSFSNKIYRLLFRPIRGSRHLDIAACIISVTGLLVLPHISIFALCAVSLAGLYYLHCRSHFEMQNETAKKQEKQVAADFAYYLQHGLLNADRLKRFQDKGIDLQNYHFSYGRTALSLAVPAGKIDVLKLLIKNGAQAQDRDAIDSAIFNGNDDVLKFLLTFQKDIDCADKNGKTPLIIAILYEKKEIVRYLLSKGAYTGENKFVTQSLNFMNDVTNQPNANKDSCTILDYAKRFGNNEIIQLIEQANKKSYRSQPKPYSETKATSLASNKPNGSGLKRAPIKTKAVTPKETTVSVTPAFNQQKQATKKKNTTAKSDVTKVTAKHSPARSL